MTVTHTNDNTFDQDVLKSNKPVIVDFWAEWCGPCKTIAPILEELPGELDDRLVVAKVNIDNNPATPQKYGIRGIPTMIMFRNGEVVGTKVGSISKNELKKWAQQFI